MASGIVESSNQGSESSQGSSRSKLVQRLLDSGLELPQFVNHLITTQAVVVAGTEAAAFLVQREDDGGVGLQLVQHVRPDESTPEMRQAAIRAFGDLIRPCVQQNKDGAIEVGAPDDGEPQYCLVTLLRNEGAIVAVSAVITRCRDLERAKQRLGSMQLVAGYFDLYTLRKTAEQFKSAANRHQHVLQYASAVATAEGFESAAMNLCNELANRTGASRVSLGWYKGTRVRVKALSHTEKFDKKQELIVGLERVMEECFDQDEPVRFDPEGACSPNVTRAAREFSSHQQNVVVISMPLRRREETVGVVTLEFLAQNKPDGEGEAGIAVAVELLAPQLFDRYDNDRYIVTKVALSFRKLGGLLIGPKHMLAKMIVLLVLGAAAFVTLYQPMYHVSAPFQLQPVEKRVLCAPYDGMIERVAVRPGQPVKEGEVIAVFYTDDLQKDLGYWQSQKDKARSLADAYRSDEEKGAEYKQAEADYAAALAKIKLLEEHIQKATLRAPFTGVVLKGDLKDFENTTRKEGEALFEIARSDASDPRRIKVQAEIAVADRDIEEVRRMLTAYEKSGRGDDQGKIATNSFPQDSYGMRITRIVPVGEAKDGTNTYRVFADIPAPPDYFFPGMTGEARIAIENRRLVWIWTHRLVDYLRLKLWF